MNGFWIILQRILHLFCCFMFLVCVHIGLPLFGKPIRIVLVVFVVPYLRIVPRLRESTVPCLLSKRTFLCSACTYIAEIYRHYGLGTFTADSLCLGGNCFRSVFDYFQKTFKKLLTFDLLTFIHLYVIFRSRQGSNSTVIVS